MICRGRASEEGGEEERILIRRLGERTSERTLPLPKSTAGPDAAAPDPSQICPPLNYFRILPLAHFWNDSTHSHRQSQTSHRSRLVAPPIQIWVVVRRPDTLPSPVQLLIFLSLSKFSPCTYRAIARPPTGALRITCPLHAA